MRIKKSKAEAHFIAKNPVVEPAMVSGEVLAVREKLEMIVGRLGGFGQLGEKDIALDHEIADLIAFGHVHERCAIPTLSKCQRMPRVPARPQGNLLEQSKRKLKSYR
ncbi:MAG TPA: hypothetical protein VGH83_08695 [Candidatus Acidoferrum sp.]